MNKLGCKATTNITQISAAHTINYLVNELLKNYMQMVIDNGIDMF